MFLNKLLILHTLPMERHVFCAVSNCAIFANGVVLNLPPTNRADANVIVLMTDLKCLLHKSIIERESLTCGMQQHLGYCSVESRQRGVLQW